VDRVVDLTDFSRFKPDVAKLACGRLAAARQRLGWSQAELASALEELVKWKVSAEIVEAWETQTTPPGDVLVAADLLMQRKEGGSGSDAGALGTTLFEALIEERFSDLVNVFPSRAAFMAALPPDALFQGASDISIAGLSLNLVCQHYSEQRLRRLLQNGSRMRCLFLAPNGNAMRAREQEEGYRPGALAHLTEVNIGILCRLRRTLDADAQQRFVLATYDEPVRFNVVLVDNRLCVAQPYLPGDRGVDSPTFLVRRRSDEEGIFGTFERAFAWLWDRSTPIW
jgi:hypothetical protein